MPILHQGRFPRLCQPGAASLANHIEAIAAINHCSDGPDYGLYTRLCVTGINC
jgi:hypothetical protein